MFEMGRAAPFRVNRKQTGRNVGARLNVSRFQAVAQATKAIKMRGSTGVMRIPLFHLVNAHRLRYVGDQVSKEIEM